MSKVGADKAARQREEAIKHQSEGRLAQGSMRYGELDLLIEQVFMIGFGSG